MGCIVAIAAVAVPRVVMFLAFLLTDWFGRAVETRLWPLLGFLLMPYTTLARGLRAGVSASLRHARPG